MTHDDAIKIARKALDNLEAGAMTMTRQEAAVDLSALLIATKRIGSHHEISLPVLDARRGISPQVRSFSSKR